MNNPEFSVDDKKELRKLGVSDKKIVHLRVALVCIEATLAPQAARNETVALLNEIESLSKKLVKKLEELLSQPTEAHKSAHLLIEKSYWAIPERKGDSGPTSSDHLLPRLKAISKSAHLGISTVPTKQTRNKSAHPWPIEKIDRILNLSRVCSILCNRDFVYCFGIRSSNIMVNRFSAAFQL